MHPSVWTAGLIAASVITLSSGSPRASQEMDHAHALVMVPGSHTLFLGTHNGMLQSKDEGRTWVPISLAGAPKGIDVMTLVADPSNPQVLYAGPTSGASFGPATEERPGRSSIMGCPSTSTATSRRW
ncbi:MAG: hypothetical protein AAB289_05975 [Chloroflexota bacterium]